MSSSVATTASYIIDDVQVVAEEFDGEIVVIHFGNGTYFSLRAAAVDIWRALQSTSGSTVEDIARRFIVTATHDEMVIRDKVTKAFEQLIDAQLLIASSKGQPLKDTSAQVMLDFSPPVIEAFADLQDLIVLDPVHEVDATAGWPNRATDAGQYS